MEGLLPRDAYELIANFANSLIENAKPSLGWGAAFSILFGIFSANKGTNALFTGLNIAYKEKDSRPFIGVSC